MMMLSKIATKVPFETSIEGRVKSVAGVEGKPAAVEIRSLDAGTGVG